jgi:hypothetical protein
MLVLAKSALCSGVNGFRGVPWCENIEKKSSEFVFVNNDPELIDGKIYIRKNDERRIGGAELERIEYVFIDNKFHSVRIFVSSVENFEELRLAATEKFGPKFSVDQDKNSISWPDDGNTIVSLYYFPSRETGTFEIISSVMVGTERKKSQQRASDGAKNDF